LAVGLCGESDRIYSSRLLGPCHRGGRRTSMKNCGPECDHSDLCAGLPE
jgi:hypothetical protein